MPSSSPSSARLMVLMEAPASRLMPPMVTLRRVKFISIVSITFACGNGAAGILQCPQVGGGVGLVAGFGASVLDDPPLVARNLRRSELERQLVDLAGELERQLVAVVHAGAGINADVEGLVDRHDERDRVRDRLAGNLLAVNGQHAAAALAIAGPVIFEIERDGVLARLERRAQPVPRTDAGFPAVSFQVQHVVYEDRLALQQIETVAAESAAEGRDHSFSAALRD